MGRVKDIRGWVVDNLEKAHEYQEKYFTAKEREVTHRLGDLVMQKQEVLVIISALCAAIPSDNYFELDGIGCQDEDLANQGKELFPPQDNQLDTEDSVFETQIGLGTGYIPNSRSSNHF